MFSAYWDSYLPQNIEAVFSNLRCSSVNGPVKIKSSTDLSRQLDTQVHFVWSEAKVRRGIVSRFFILDTRWILWTSTFFYFVFWKEHPVSSHVGRITLSRTRQPNYCSDGKIAEPTQRFSENTGSARKKKIEIQPEAASRIFITLENWQNLGALDT